MADLERRFTFVPVELRARGDKQTIGGYAAVFNRVSQNLGEFVEMVGTSFFNKSRGDGWPEVVARYNHDDNMLLGSTAASTLRLTVDETGLSYDVDPPTARADIVELVERGDVRKSSFAFRLFEDDWGVTDQGFPMRTLVSGSLVDVAPVVSPAYTDTTAAIRSLAEKMGAAPEEIRKLAEAHELSRLFKRSGGPPATMFGPKAVAILQAKKDLQLD